MNSHKYNSVFNSNKVLVSSELNKYILWTAVPGAISNMLHNEKWKQCKIARVDVGAGTVGVKSV